MLVSCAVTAQLICIYFFHLCKKQVYHEVAHIFTVVGCGTCWPFQKEHRSGFLIQVCTACHSSFRTHINLYDKLQQQLMITSAIY